MKRQENAAHEGQVIADVYRLEEPLGRGAMGRIWRAEHLRLKSKVAIKFLDPAISDDPDTFNRFLREAQSAAAVRSAHVVQIFDCGIDDGIPYISMELLEGESLDKRLFTRTALTAAELDKVFTEVARGVDAAHESGVIHRDLKPGNVFITRERDLEITKVLDFGIAKLMNRAVDIDSAAGTRTGTMLGTPYYMSPEQVRGSRGLDQRTDLWSLAIIAFECLTGELPFRGESMGDIVVQICTVKPTLPSELVDAPPGFDEWFSKGTSKEPSERFETARQMAESLSEILSLSPTPLARAKGFRAGAAREPKTLPSVPAPFGPDPAAPGSAPREPARATPRGGWGTIAPASSARVPPSPSTRPLITPILSASDRSAADGLRRARGRWLWVAAPITLLCGTGAVVLWPFAPERMPYVVEGGTLAAASSPSAAPGEVKALAAGHDTIGKADVAVEGVALTSTPLASPPPSQPASPPPSQPASPPASQLVTDTPSSAASSLDVPRGDRGAPGQASVARTGGSKPSASSRPSVARQTTLRPRTSTTKKPPKGEHSSRATPAPGSAAAPPAIPRERGDSDPFSERR